MFRILVCMRVIFSTEATRSYIDLLSDLDRVAPPLSSPKRQAAPTKLRGGGDDKPSHDKKLLTTLDARKAMLGWAWGGKDRSAAQLGAFEALLERLRSKIPGKPLTVFCSFAPLARHLFSSGVRNFLACMTRL